MTSFLITDDEIYSVVMEWCKGEQNRERDGGDDFDVDSLDVVKPTCQEVITAAFILQNYVADLDNPFAWNLEVMLANFNHQTWLDEVQSLQPMIITDYFTPQDV